MGVDTFKRDMQYYLKHRTHINAKCIKPADHEKNEESKLCSRVIMTDDPECYCEAYIHPEAQWRRGVCFLADSFLKTDFIEAEKIKLRVGQQKQSKKKKSRR